MNKILYTIGHSTQTIEEFLELLKQHGINCIVDVRSVPYSQFASQFNEDNIKQALKQEGVAYIRMSKEFGARREDPNLYGTDGKVDFEKTAESNDFLSGVSRIKTGLEKGYNIAFMCTEKNPMDCHRCILIGKEFDDIEGIHVENILADGSLISQEAIGKQLLDMYFPNRNQLSLFDLETDESNLEEDYLRRAYKKREEEIAYAVNDNKE